MLYQTLLRTYSKMQIRGWKRKAHIAHQHYKDTLIERSAIRNILLIKLYGIGNMVLFTPTLQEIKRLFPQAHVTLMTQNSCVEIIKGTDYYDDIIFYPPYTNYESDPVKFYREVTGLRGRKFDLIVSSFIMGDKTLPPLLYLLGAHYLVGYSIDGAEVYYTHILEYDKKRHEVDLNLDLLKVLGLEVHSPELDIKLTEKERAYASQFVIENGLAGKVVVGFHPGSDEPLKAKRWSKEGFAALGDLIYQTYGAHIMILGSEREGDYISEIGQLMSTTPLCLAGTTTLREAAALIERCHLFVSNDSGLMHIASAVKTPVIGIFGPTILDKNYPWGNKTINRTICKGLSCSPCYSFGGITCDEVKCLKEISVHDVMCEVHNMMRNISMRAHM